MEQNRGVVFAIGLIALVLGVALGFLLCGGNRVRVATDIVGRDFRAGQPYRYSDNYYYRTDRLGASAYDSYSRRENVRYEYYETPQTVIFHSTDCTNPATIDRFSREFNDRQWRDFEDFCQVAGYPLG